MNAQEVEIESRHRNERVYGPLNDRCLPERNQFRYGGWRALRRNSFEPYAGSAVGIGFDDIYILFLVLTGIPNLATRQPM